MSTIDYHKLRSRITAQRIIRALTRDGFVFDSGEGAHRQYRYPDGRLVTVTHHHPGDTFTPKTLKSIIETQARWTIDDLKRLKLIPKIELGFLRNKPPSPPLTGGGALKEGQVTLFDDQEVRELQENRDLWCEERRQEEAEQGWIWRPTAEDLEWSKGTNALRFVAPILEVETGEPIKGQVYLEGFWVAHTSAVDLLILKPPIGIRVEAAGYHAWDVVLGSSTGDLGICMAGWSYGRRRQAKGLWASISANRWKSCSLAVRITQIS